MAKRTLSVALLAAAALASCTSAPDPKTMGRFAFMIGCWRSADGTNTEVWSAPSGGMMFGYATTMKGGALSYFEQTRIDMNKPKAVYTASPLGQRPTEFTEDGMGGMTGVTFAAPDHDYPQKISYRADKKNLVATTSLMDGSRPQEYRWAPCK